MFHVALFSACFLWFQWLCWVFCWSHVRKYSRFEYSPCVDLFSYRFSLILVVMAPPKKRGLPKPLPEGFIMADTERKRWRLGKIIGQGGFGLIYLGKHLYFTEACLCLLTSPFFSLSRLVSVGELLSLSCLFLCCVSCLKPEQHEFPSLWPQ